MRTLAKHPLLALMWPSAMLAIAIAMDQATRGPSITAMLLQYVAG